MLIKISFPVEVKSFSESWGLISVVLVLVNDCHSDVSPVNNSDSDSSTFGYFLRIFNWSPVDKSAHQVSNKNSNGIISGTQCIELLTDLHICTGEFIPVE